MRLMDNPNVLYQCVSLFRIRLWSCPGAMDLQFSSAGLTTGPPPAWTAIKWSYVDNWEKS